MARQNQMKVREALLALAALLAIPAAAAAAQLAADRHTLRYDGEVNIGESGRAGEIERSIKVSSGLSSRCDERERERDLQIPPVVVGRPGGTQRRRREDDYKAIWGKVASFLTSGGARSSVCLSV